MSDTTAAESAPVAYDTSGRPVYVTGHNFDKTAKNLVSWANKVDPLVTPTEVAIAIAVTAGDSYAEFAGLVYKWKEAAKIGNADSNRILLNTAKSLVGAIRGTHPDEALNAAYREYLAAWLQTDEGKRLAGSVNSKQSGKGRAMSALAFLAGEQTAAPKLATGPFAKERAARQAAESERDAARAALAAAGIDLDALRGDIEK
jgi:hypothetical protein